MASVLKVDKLDPQSGTALEIGTSGDTISVPSGATLDISASTLTPPATMPASSGINFTALNATNLGSGTVAIARGGTGAATLAGAGLANTPSFWAGRTATQSSIVSGTATKVEFNTEAWDTDGEYDHTTNYRFTPQTAGKYFFSAGIACYAEAGVSKMSRMYLKLYLNGAAWSRSTLDLRNSLYYEGVPSISGAISLNGSSDYIEVYIQAYTDSGDVSIDGNSTPSQNWFTAYKLIGVQYGNLIK